MNNWNSENSIGTLQAIPKRPAVLNGFKAELTENILPFWMTKMQDIAHGGFYGRIDGTNILHPKANRGAILNARILWTFSAAYRLLKHPEYLKMAERAFDYITRYFIDKEDGGVYWELDYRGKPVNTKKQTYAQGFALYGFSEFYRATGNPEALELAKTFFRLLEEKCRDRVYGGYFEAFTKEWETINDMRLSSKDANEKKSMNTNLHVLEAYTNLYRIWEEQVLKETQWQLIDIFIHKIINKRTHSLKLFFDEQWTGKSSEISFGHDIEASWLLLEAASVLKEASLLEKITDISLEMAESALDGIEEWGGGMTYGMGNGLTDADKHWWVQAEAVVGYMYAYRNSGDPSYKRTAISIWNYIKNRLIDTEYGEWYWSRNSDGSINREGDKAGFWKCPYHNGRMCMEMMENFKITD